MEASRRGSAPSTRAGAPRSGRDSLNLLLIERLPGDGDSIADNDKVFGALTISPYVCDYA